MIIRFPEKYKSLKRLVWYRYVLNTTFCLLFLWFINVGEQKIFFLKQFFYIFFSRVRSINNSKHRMVYINIMNSYNGYDCIFKRPLRFLLVKKYNNKTKNNKIILNLRLEYEIDFIGLAHNNASFTMLY